jgi:hypothetical protein
MCTSNSGLREKTEKQNIKQRSVQNRMVCEQKYTTTHSQTVNEHLKRAQLLILILTNCKYKNQL